MKLIGSFLKKHFKKDPAYLELIMNGLDLKTVSGFDQNKISKIKLIFGLGNPGAKYKKQRHNVGSLLCEKICELNLSRFQLIKSFLYFKSIPQNYIFAKTEAYFMNDSGKVLKDLIKYFSLKIDEVLIVHDELELKFGTIKFGDGSSKGHNGIKSIFNETGFQDFYRLKIGIGRPQNREDVPSFVLENFSEEEFFNLEALFSTINQFLLI